MNHETQEKQSDLKLLKWTSLALVPKTKPTLALVLYAVTHIRIIKPHPLRQIGM